MQQRALEDVYPDMLKENVPEKFQYDRFRRFSTTRRRLSSLKPADDLV
jgi:hypothetical protein